MQHNTYMKSSSSPLADGASGEGRLTPDERHDVAGGNRLVAFLAMILLCGLGSGVFFLVRLIAGLLAH
jgi:hypothetical protein